MDRRRLFGLALTLPLAALPLFAGPAASAAPERKPASKPAIGNRLVMLDPGHGGADPGAIGTLGTREKDVTLDIAAPERKPASKPAIRNRLVMLDPGHGGADPGAIGTLGTREKDVTLDIARAVARTLRERHRVTARLTRDDDRFLALEERVALTRKAGADLFVSIHADSAPSTQARGLSAYTLSDKASDAFASRLAQQENRADRYGGLEIKGTTRVVKDILIDLTARHTRNASLVARQALVRGAGKDLRLLDNPMRSANFAVLKAPDVPSVLVETGFLSNPHDERILRDANARLVVARVLAREIAAVLTARGFA